MTLTLHQHPLSSACWKVLIGLYEKALPFERAMVNLGDPAVRAAFLRISPMGKMPVLEDSGAARFVYETSIILDYLDQHHAGAVRLIPLDPDAARDVRLRDRMIDFYIHDPMQRIVADRLRPKGQGDALGVEQARAQLRMGFDWLEAALGDNTWAAGEDFSLADCAALPALFYGDLLEPLGPQRPRCSAYLARLRARPSVTRVIEEAKPFFQYYPGTPEERARLPA